jgi:hypothetical protein
MCGEIFIDGIFTGANFGASKREATSDTVLRALTNSSPD